MDRLHFEWSYKRLERGRFIWPQATSGSVALTPAQLSMLLEGIDWRMPVRTHCPELAAAQLGPVSTPSPAEPHTIEGLLRVIGVRDGELAVLRLMVDKLKLQLLRRVRAQFGTSSEQLQASLIDEQALSVPACKSAGTKAEAANASTIDRNLPEHLPREAQVHRPETNAAHHDAAGQPCGCTACGGRLRQIGQDVSEQLEYVPARFKVIRHVRPKLACVRCQSIFQADAASRPLAPLAWPLQACWPTCWCPSIAITCRLHGRP